MIPALLGDSVYSRRLQEELRIEDDAQVEGTFVGPGCRIAVVIPCYKERQKILGVLDGIPDFVDRVYCVDDACPDNTGEFVEENRQDQRISVMRNTENQGVGGAVVAGYRAALIDGADIIVKIDGDGQMDPSHLPRFIRPIIGGHADYAKGNRFYEISTVADMPPMRLFGNAMLSFFCKLSTGYWRIFDPNNGYTAIHAEVLKLVPLDKIHKGFFFESDMLFRLGALRAMVIDVPHNAVYEDEESQLRIVKAIPTFAYQHGKNFLKRLFYCYFLRDFNIASLQLIAGPLLLLFGAWVGLASWVQSSAAGIAATPGTVMLAALPLIVGLQLLLSALNYDIENQPDTPIHPVL